MRKAVVHGRLGFLFCLALTFATQPSCQTNPGDIVVIPSTTATSMSDAEHRRS